MARSILIAYWAIWVFGQLISLCVIPFLVSGDPLECSARGISHFQTKSITAHFASLLTNSRINSPKLVWSLFTSTIQGGDLLHAKWEPSSLTPTKFALVKSTCLANVPLQAVWKWSECIGQAHGPCCEVQTVEIENEHEKWVSQTNYQRFFPFSLFSSFSLALPSWKNVASDFVSKRRFSLFKACQFPPKEGWCRLKNLWLWIFRIF